MTTEKKLSDELFQYEEDEVFSSWYRQARALEERVEKAEAERKDFMLESQRKEAEANALASEVARLRAENERLTENWRWEMHARAKALMGNDALRAQLAEVRAECGLPLTRARAKRHDLGIIRDDVAEEVVVFADDILAILDKGGSE